MTSTQRTPRAFLSSVALAAVAAFTLLAPAAAQAKCDDTVHRSYGVTPDQSLVSFRTCRPGKFTAIGAVQGLQGADSRLVGIDFRVQDGLLYGVGNAGGIYTLDLGTAFATKVSQLTTALDGDHFGVDFNPAANALRIVSDKGQNLRHPFALPEPRTTLVDLALNYTPGVTALGVVSAAYTNNDLDLNTATTLFAIDATLDQLVLQAPPNNGTLAATGKLGLDTAGPAGFDIYSRLKNGVTLENHAVATLSSGGVTTLYTIDLLTGKASRVAPLAGPLVDFAASLGS